MSIPVLIKTLRRDIEKELISWKSQKGRYPLIIRGARQVSTFLNR